MSTSKAPGLIRVVLCDDHELFRQGLVEMLNTAEDIRVVGEGNTHERAVAVVSEARPDVVLLDLEMPHGTAEETLRDLLGLPSPPRIIIVTMYDEPRLIRRFIGIGASAYLPKSTSLEELLDTVRNVAAIPQAPSGESKPRIVPQEVLKDLDGHADGLSGREVEILLQAARGMSNQQIAASLHLSEATVKRHLANTYSKIGVGSRTEAPRRHWRKVGSPLSNSRKATSTGAQTGLARRADGRFTAPPKCSRRPEPVADLPWTCLALRGLRRARLSARPCRRCNAWLRGTERPPWLRDRLRRFRCARAGAG